MSRGLAVELGRTLAAQALSRPVLGARGDRSFFVP
jgi:hypothetical protein